MNFFERIRDRAKAIHSWVCVGLDIDPGKLPAHLAGEKNAQKAFGAEIVGATHDLALCYKINSAFFEAEGLIGYATLQELIADIGQHRVPVILDAKRGDIGNSSRQYARAAFEVLGADAVTVSPYLGQDALQPFLDYGDKGTIVLGVTSNPGGKDFQFLDCGGSPLYEQVVRKVAAWNSRDNCGLVVGATQGEVFERLRQIAPELPFLVPGVGAQGGALEPVVRWGVTTSGVPPIINSSRAILYASGGKDFAEAARAATLQLRDGIQQARRGSDG